MHSWRGGKRRKKGKGEEGKNERRKWEEMKMENKSRGGKENQERRKQNGGWRIEKEERKNMEEERKKIWKDGWWERGGGGDQLQSHAQMFASCKQALLLCLCTLCLRSLTMFFQSCLFRDLFLYHVLHFFLLLSKVLFFWNVAHSNAQNLEILSFWQCFCILHQQILSHYSFCEQIFCPLWRSSDPNPT